MKIKIDGIAHFSKLMNFLSCINICDYWEAAKEEFEEYIEDWNYHRDWWSDCVLYKDKHRDYIIGFVQKEPRKYFINSKI